MKLLIYSHFFPPSMGGVETVVSSLAHGLAEERRPDGSPEFDLTLVTQTPSAEFPDADLPFHVVRQPGILLLRNLIRQADVVHVAGAAISPIVNGLLARKPVIVEHHGFQPFVLPGNSFKSRRMCPAPAISWQATTGIASTAARIRELLETVQASRCGT